MNRILITALFKCVVESDFKTVKIKFIGKGAKEEEVEKYIEDFKKLRDGNRIKKVNEKNIDYWGKQPFKDFTRFINDLKETKSKTQENKLKKMEGAELVAENDLWFIYKITTYKASCFYGSGTKWCTTSSKTSRYFDSYNLNSDFYYFISKTRDKEDPLHKIALKKSSGHEAYFDADDEHLESSSEIEIKKELPEFKIPEPNQKDLKERQRVMDLIVKKVKEGVENIHNNFDVYYDDDENAGLRVDWEFKIPEETKEDYSKRSEKIIEAVKNLNLKSLEYPADDPRIETYEGNDIYIVKLIVRYTPFDMEKVLSEAKKISEALRELSK